MPVLKPISKDYPITLKHGDRWPQKSFTLSDQAGNALSGFTIKMQVKTKSTDSIPVKTLIDGNGFVIVGNLVTFDAQVDFPPGPYVHDIQVTLADGHIYTIYEGTVTVTQDVTT